MFGGNTASAGVLPPAHRLDLGNSASTHVCYSRGSVSIPPRWQYHHAGLPGHHPAAERFPWQHPAAVRRSGAIPRRKGKTRFGGNPTSAGAIPLAHRLELLACRGDSTSAGQFRERTCSSFSRFGCNTTMLHAEHVARRTCGSRNSSSPSSLFAEHVAREAGSRSPICAVRAGGRARLLAVQGWRSTLLAEHGACGAPVLAEHRCLRSTVLAEHRACGARCLRRTLLAVHAVCGARCLRSTLLAVHAARGARSSRSTLLAKQAARRV